MRCAVNHLLWLHVLTPPPDSYRDPLSADAKRGGEDKTMNIN